MLCECGCPINLKPYKRGESTIDILNFAQKSLLVSIFIYLHKKIYNILLGP